MNQNERDDLEREVWKDAANEAALHAQFARDRNNLDVATAMQKLSDTFRKNSRAQRGRFDG